MMFSGITLNKHCMQIVFKKQTASPERFSMTSEVIENKTLVIFRGGEWGWGHSPLQSTRR